MQYLLNQLAQLVASGGHVLQGQTLARSVHADAICTWLVARLVQQCFGLVGIKRILGHVGIVARLLRVYPRVRHRKLAIHQLLDQGFPVNAHEQRLPHPLVGQGRVIAVHVDLLIDQQHGEFKVELLLQSGLFGHGQRLVDGQAQHARNEIEVARTQVGLQRGGVVDGLDSDALEMRLLTPPVRVRLEY